MIKIDVACDATIIIHYGFGDVLVNERDVHNLERKKPHNNPLLRWLVGFAHMYLAKYIHVWAQEVTINIAYSFRRAVVHTQENPAA